VLIRVAPPLNTVCVEILPMVAVLLPARAGSLGGALDRNLRRGKCPPAALYRPLTQSCRSDDRHAPDLIAGLDEIAISIRDSLL